jgi:hypothetical protein
MYGLSDPTESSLQVYLQLAIPGSCHKSGECTKLCVDRSVCSCNKSGGSASIPVDPSCISSRNMRKMLPSHF